MIDGIRNMLHEFLGIIQDLYALNIQRGRDHGLPSYNQMRKALGLNELKSFS